MNHTGSRLAPSTSTAGGSRAIFRGARPVFHPSGNDHEFAGSHFEAPLFSGLIAKLHAKFALYHQEEFVLVVVMVPHEFALELDQLDMLAVQFTDDSGAPMFMERGEFVPQGDLLHGFECNKGESQTAAVIRFQFHTSFSISHFVQWSSY